MGIVNTVKTMSQSSGPFITGSLAGSGRFWIAFVVAGGLKIGYDVGMLGMFVKARLQGDEGEQRPDPSPEEGIEEHESIYTLDSRDDIELDDMQSQASGK